MSSESPEDQCSEKSNGPTASCNDVPNGNGQHSEQQDEIDYSDEDSSFADESACRQTYQQDDRDRATPPEIKYTPTPVDRENEVPNNETGRIAREGNVIDGVWYMPLEKEDCTLEEIRRGQVVNGLPANRCPVPGCMKVINEAKIDPSPGTISSGLRTHFLFVHYGVNPNRKVVKKKKSLGRLTMKGLRTSPRKLATHTSQMLAASSKQDQDTDVDFSNINSSDITNSLSNLIQKSSTPINLSRTDLDKRFKRVTPDQQNIHSISSLQSLIQASGAQKTVRPAKKQQDSNAAINDQINPMASSLFSILAGLTQQQQMNPPAQQPISKNIKSASRSNNSVTLSQCRANSHINRPANSSLLSLLNEKISGNVASSLQNQLRKTITTDGRPNIQRALRQYNDLSSYGQTDNQESNYNNGGTSILTGLVSNNGDNRITLDSSIPINSFIETMASKTGSNIGPQGVAHVKKMLEKFTTSLLYSSQTIADHYVESFGGDVAQQKPEIKESDITLAYKMILKSHGQP